MDESIASFIVTYWPILVAIVTFIVFFAQMRLSLSNNSIEMKDKMRNLRAYVDDKMYNSREYTDVRLSHQEKKIDEISNKLDHIDRSQVDFQRELSHQLQKIWQHLTKN